MGLPPDELTARARQIRLLLLDVDGVLTDGSLLVDSAGGELKQFSIRDGAAMMWARHAGLEIALLSGRPSQATSRRAAELGIETVLQGGPDKRAPFQALLEQRGLDGHTVAYMGDDLLDLPVLGRVGLSAAPVDAAPEVRTRVHWVSRHGGGQGAVRELIELVLRAQHAWDAVVAEYLD